MKNVLFLICILFGAISFSACDDEPKKTDEQEIYLETTYRNYAWGQQWSGTFTDSKGAVHAYNMPANWHYCDSLGEIDKDSLLSNFAQCDTIIKYVNADSLKTISNYFAEAANGEMSPKTQIGADMGSRKYYAYIYNPETKKYKRITLKVIGDWSYYNTSPAALEIMRWWAIIPQVRPLILPPIITPKP